MKNTSLRSETKWVPLSEVANQQIDLPDSVIGKMMDDLSMKLEAHPTIGPALKKAVASSGASNKK